MERSPNSPPLFRLAGFFSPPLPRFPGRFITEILLGDHSIFLEINSIFLERKIFLKTHANSIMTIFSELDLQVGPDLKHWSFVEMFKYNRMSLDTEAYPFRVFHSGARGSLHFVSKVSTESLDQIGSLRAIFGFGIIIHAPYEFPCWIDGHYISNNQSATVLIKPNVILPSADLDAVTPNDRNCFFQSERKLKYFKMYTQYNCFVECGWNRTLKECGCASVGMQRKCRLRAHETFNNDTNVPQR